MMYRSRHEYFSQGRRGTLTGNLLLVLAGVALAGVAFAVALATGLVTLLSVSTAPNQNQQAAQNQTNSEGTPKPDLWIQSYGPVNSLLSHLDLNGGVFRHSPRGKLECWLEIYKSSDKVDPKTLIKDGVTDVDALEKLKYTRTGNNFPLKTKEEIPAKQAGLIVFVIPTSSRADEKVHFTWLGASVDEEPGIPIVGEAGPRVSGGAGFGGTLPLSAPEKWKTRTTKCERFSHHNPKRGEELLLWRWVGGMDPDGYAWKIELKAKFVE